jgi:DNA-binding NarL/FixJ family response regulator
MTRILVADDQVLVRGGLRMILEAQPDIEVVGERATAARRWRWRASWGPTSS